MTDWAKDINDMHKKFGFHDWVETAPKEHLRKMIDFRLNFLGEELLETRKAAASGDAAEVVDGLIDLCVVAIGTLDLYGVDAHEAWDRVHGANMAKERGVKPGRPNPLGLPDLMKPEGWTSPTHDDNVGKFDDTLKNG